MELFQLYPICSRVRSNVALKRTTPRSVRKRQLPFSKYQRMLSGSYNYVAYKKSNTLYKKHSVNTPRSFMSDVCLYDLSHTDIFLSSVIRNMPFVHLPLLFIYRRLQLSWEYSITCLFIASFLRTIIQMIELSSSA